MVPRFSQRPTDSGNPTSTSRPASRRISYKTGSNAISTPPSGSPNPYLRRSPSSMEPDDR